MRFSFSLLLSMVSIAGLTQGGNNTFKLPEILPPSPDVAALSKAAELSSTPHTGGPNASIPVYQLKVGSYSLPISINYSSNGYKPEEIPSRVGLNWTLSAGGSVSRITRGKPDDYCTVISNYLSESQITAYNSTAYYFITDLEDQSSYHDGMPDEYRYNVNGLSGKFIIKRDGTVLQLPYNNVKISVVKNASGAVTDIYIKDGSGVHYTFGEGQLEQTLEHNLVNNMLQKQNITTAWMLTRINIPDGNLITFDYGSLSHYVQSGVMESVRKGIVGAYCSPPPPGENIPCPVDAQYSSKTNLVRYTSRYLTAINTSTGPAVAIVYADRPDAGGDNRVDQINVSNGYGVTVRKVQLEYLDRHSSTNTPFNEGFFLKKVYVKDPSASSSEQQVFELAYVDETNAGAGAVFTYGVDHLGFANGASNSTLLPVVGTYVYNGYPLFANEGTANREPNGNYSQKGMLQKITYPTVGYDEFYYEPNMKTWWDSVDVHNIINARAAGIGDNYPYHFYTTYFTPARSGTGEFHLKTEWLGSPPIPDGDPAPKVAFARLYVNSTNELVAMRTAEGFAGGAHYLVDGNLAVGLTAGVEYKLEIEVRYGTSAYGQADIVYDAGVGKEWKQLNEELCGVRVRKILSYDPVSRKSVSKFYSYRSLTDTITPSANKLYYPEYVTPYQNGLFCDYMEVVCNGFVLSSNSATSLYANEAAGVTYKWVIESDDSLFANGGIEHSYYTQGGFLGIALVGGAIPNPPTDMYNYINGIDTQTVYFNNNRQLLKKVNNYYSIDSRINEAQFSNYIVRKRYEKVLVGPPWDDYDFEHLDVISYPVYTRWDHIDSTVTKEYDLVNNKVLKTKTSFNYATTAVVQPSAVVSKMSDGSETKKEMKYPTDLIAQAVCSTMVAKNIVNPVIEEKTYKDSKLLYQTNTDYKDWFNNATILAPELVKNQKNSSSQETRIRYYQYDSKGNPLELSKENDVHITYIWDYSSTLPIAEVTNASWGFGVAYTSFEADGKGGWSFSGAATTEGTEPAGKKSYALSGGNITYPGTLAGGKKYYITYWAKGGAVLVNSAAGTSLLTKNSWTLYKRTLTYSGSGGITVSGSGYIDELRLYPDSSFMKTFTYTPEVGTTTAADNNSLYQQYEYDVFNRLLRIRDMDRNILKQYEYKYGSDVTGCVNTTANWQATGNYRCAKNNFINNNNTGIKEQEELDLNNCSETYGQTRWVSIGTSAECPVVSNCSGVDKRVINGVCYTGCKQLLSSVYIGNLQWDCKFRYFWVQDGFTGPEFTETHTSYCIGTTCGL